MAPRVNKTENSKIKQDASPVKRGPGRPRKVVPEVDVEQRTPAVKIVNKKLRPDSPDIVEIEDSDEGHRKFLEYADEVIAAADDEEDDTALDPNDSMYPEPPRSSRIQVGHQDRPITPPLNTRSGHTRTFAQRDSPDGIPDAPGMTPDFSSPSKRARTAKGKQIKQYESPDDDDDVMAISNNNASPLAFKSPAKSILPSNKSTGSYHREDDDDDDDDIFPETISNIKRVDAKKSSAPALKATKKTQKIESEDEVSEVEPAPKPVRAAKKTAAPAPKASKKTQKIESEDEVSEVEPAPKPVRTAKKTAAPAPKANKKTQKIESEDEVSEVEPAPKPVRAAKKTAAPAPKATKKTQKIESEDEVSEVEPAPKPVRAAKKAAPAPKAAKKIQKVESEDEGEVEPVLESARIYNKYEKVESGEESADGATSPKHVHASQMPIAPDSDKGVKAIKPDSDSDIESVPSKDIVHMSDLTTLRVRELPSVCEWKLDDCKDPELDAKELYKDLPPLRKFAFIPSNVGAKPGYGNVRWSGWCKKLAEGFRPRMALAAISFVSDGRYGNLSRMSPLDITGRSIGSLYAPRYELSIGKDTGLFLTTVSIDKSFLLQYNPQMKYSAFYVTGRLLCVYGERTGALICMVMGQDEVKTNIWSDTFSFVEGPESSGQKSQSNNDDDDMYNPRSSPIKVKVVPPVRGLAGGKIVKPLVFGTPIKVYNAIGKKFKFDSSTFDNLDELFPLWEDELPYRSYTIVCHTCQVYKSPTNGTVLNYYIQWILLLGLPL